MEVCLIAFSGEANDGNKLMLNVDGAESGGKNPWLYCFPLLLCPPASIVTHNRIK